jgi:prepilin-type N-terminal cleavage/methylation domain-containing protein
MRTRLAREESGFTMPELLVVVVIIGVLAAIALGVFATQKEKGQDADAKSNASSLVAHVDSCYVETGNFIDCDGQGPNDDLGNTGLPMGSGRGEVSVTSSTVNTFTVTSTSDQDHHFRVQQGPTSQQTHTCDAGPGDINGGGCSDGSW